MDEVRRPGRQIPSLSVPADGAPDPSRKYVRGERRADADRGVKNAVQSIVRRVNIHIMYNRDGQEHNAHEKRTLWPMQPHRERNDRDERQGKKGVAKYERLKPAARALRVQKRHADESAQNGGDLPVQGHIPAVMHVLLHTENGSDPGIERHAAGAQGVKGHAEENSSHGLPCPGPDLPEMCSVF